MKKTKRRLLPAIVTSGILLSLAIVAGVATTVSATEEPPCSGLSGRQLIVCQEAEERRACRAMHLDFHREKNRSFHATIRTHPDDAQHYRAWEQSMNAAHAQFHREWSEGSCEGKETGTGAAIGPPAAGRYALDDESRPRP